MTAFLLILFFVCPYELKAIFIFILILNLLLKPPGGFVSSIHNRTILNRIGDFKMAILF